MSVPATCWAVLGQPRGGWGALGIMVRTAGSLSSVDSVVLQLSDQGWQWGQGVWTLQEPYWKPEVCPSHLCCRKLSGRQEPADGLQVAGPKQTHQPHSLGNDEHISTAAALKVLEFLVACEVVLQPLDAFKHFCPSF